MNSTKPVAEVKINEIMTRRVETLSYADTIQDAVKLMLDSSITTVPVIDAHSKCIGILSRSDLTEMFFEEDSELAKALDSDRMSAQRLSRSVDTSDTRQVKELMTYEVSTVNGDQSVADACKEMARLKVHHLPVVDENERVVGIVSAFDVVTAIANM